jgi:limonene-1,2-epoxide hydrolase
MSIDTTTARTVHRFIEAFQQRDPSVFPDLVAPDCVMETIQPAPDGARVEGYADNVAFWQAMVSDSSGTFESEDVVICGDRAVQRWRYRHGALATDSVRGVTLFLVQDGKIAEAFAYAKIPPLEASTGRVIAQFNDAFQRHEPSLLEGLVGEACVIENTDGSRHTGRAACLALWSRIAAASDNRFDIEDVSVEGERAIIRWRLSWGEEAGSSVRGVNVMRVRDGVIVEAFGYVKQTPAGT